MPRTERLFWQDPYLLEFDAQVIERREREGRPAVVLDRTAFYAESGGQPWDTGVLDGVVVSAVIEEGEAILHVLDAPLQRDDVHGRVDAVRRNDHRQQHHGQHLLSRALEDVCGAATVSFHLGALTSTIDLDREVSEDRLAAAVHRANEVIWEARPVVVRQVSRSEATQLGLDPAAHVGESVRVIEVEGFDKNPCGGTHPRRTSEVGVVVPLGIERYKGGSRIEFVCGTRAVSEVARRNAILGRLQGALQAGLPALADAATQLVARLQESDKRNRDLLDWALDGEARRLLDAASGEPPLVVHAVDAWPAADLRTLAIKLTRLRPCVALLGSRADKAHLVFAQSDGLRHDLGALLKDALVLVEGRGGGRGNLVQGGGVAVARLDAALAAAAHAVASQAQEDGRG